MAGVRFEAREGVPICRGDSIVKRFFVLLILAGAALALAGCFSSSSNNNRGSSGPAADIRVLHAAADVPAVDIYVEGDLAVPSLAFGEATGFTSVPAGALTIDIRAAGAPADSAPVFSETVTPADGMTYTLVAYGLLGDDSFELLVIPDEQATPADDNLRLFVLHAAPAVGPVDVYLGTGDELGSATLTEFAPQDDTDGYLEVPAGAYRIRITPAGSDTVAYDSGIVDLQAGLSYFVAALDRESGFAPASTVALLGDPAFVQLDDQRAWVRAMHLSPDAPDVDVFVDGVEALSGVPFRAVSDYLTVLAGDYEVSIAPTGSTSAVSTLQVSPEAGMAYSVLAVGLVEPTNGNGLELIPIVDETVPAAGDDVLVRIIHASPDAPNVDVLADGSILPGLENVPYFTASGYLTVPQGTYNLAVNVTETDTTVIDLPDTALDAGTIYTVIATGLVGDDDLEPVLVLD